MEMHPMKNKISAIERDRQRQIIELFEHVCRCDFKLLMANVDAPWVFGESFPGLIPSEFGTLIDDLHSFAGGEILKAEKGDFLEYVQGFRSELVVEVMSCVFSTLPGSFMTIKIHQSTN